MAASAAEHLRWQLRGDAESVVLAYVMPETDVPPLLLACRQRSGEVSIGLERGGTELWDGMQAVATFTPEGGRIAPPMRAERMKRNDQFLLHGRTAPDSDLIRLLAEGRTFTISVAGETRCIPLAGARPGLAILRRDCAAPRRAEHGPRGVTDRGGSPPGSPPGRARPCPPARARGSP